MPAYGGLSPYPRRCGGGTPRLKIILESVQTSLGTAYSTDSSALIAARNNAIARMISAAWGTNERLGNIADPYRMHPSLIPRWERIMAIVPPDGATESGRRDAINLRVVAIGKNPDRQRIYDESTDVLGAAFVDLYYIPNAYAVIHVPDTSYPFGSVVENPYGTFGASNPWYSTTAHFLVLTAKPAAMTEGDYHDLLATWTRRMDPIVPTWATFDWYRAPETGAAIAVPDGPSMTGMYLDERNLNNSVFAPYPHPGDPGVFLDVFANLDRLEFA